MTKITISNQSRKSKRKYKSENWRTRSAQNEKGVNEAAEEKTKSKQEKDKLYDKDIIKD
jgi:hypothetical protein